VTMWIVMAFGGLTAAQWANLAFVGLSAAAACGADQRWVVGIGTAASGVGGSVTAGGGCWQAAPFLWPWGRRDCPSCARCCFGFPSCPYRRGLLNGNCRKRG
jgi:hypothetical protein